MALKNQINTYADLTAYNADNSKEYPNISYIIATDEVKWYKEDPDHIVCKYNVTSTDSPTTLLYQTNLITYQIIDGVIQQSVQTTYTFDTLGEHIVKYKYSGTNMNYLYTFYMCTNLTSVVFPSGITIIGSAVFGSCSNLTNVVLPNSLTSLGDRVFEYCSKLTTVTIPNSVTEIGRCFPNSGLTYIDLPNSITTLNGTFDTATNLKRINSNVDGECNIPNSVTTIKDSAFSYCTNITTINIPDSVTTIGNGVFSGNNNLRYISIGSGITSIGTQATVNSRNIQSITIKATTPPTISDTTWQSTNCPIYVPASSVSDYQAATNWSDLASRIQPIPTT